MWLLSLSSLQAAARACWRAQSCGRGPACLLALAAVVTGLEAATRGGGEMWAVGPLVTAGQLRCTSSSLWSASVKDMDEDDDDVNNGGGGLWQHEWWDPVGVVVVIVVDGDNDEHHLGRAAGWEGESDRHRLPCPCQCRCHPL